MIVNTWKTKQVEDEVIKESKSCEDSYVKNLHITGEVYIVTFQRLEQKLKLLKLMLYLMTKVLESSSHEKV